MATVTLSDPIALFVPVATANSTFKVSLGSNYTLENDIDRIFATPELRAAVADYQSNKPIKITGAESCRGTCRGKIRILGMVGGCKTMSEPRYWAKESAQRPEPLQVFKNNSITATFLNVTFNAYRYRRGIFDDVLNAVNDVLDDVEHAVDEIWLNPDFLKNLTIRSTSTSTTTKARLLRFNITYFNADPTPPIPQTFTFDDEPFTYSPCPGTLYTQICAFDLALVEYPILLTNSTITPLSLLSTTLRPPLSNKTFLTANISHPSPARLADNPVLSLLRAFSQLFSSTVAYQLADESLDYEQVFSTTVNNTTDNTTTDSEDEDSPPPTYNRTVEWNWVPAALGNQGYAQDLFLIGDPSCSKSSPDPTEGIIESMAEILFRVGVAAGGGGYFVLE